MSEQQRVVSVTTNLLISNLAKSAVLLVFFIAISRLLGANELGTYSLALAITTPLFAFGLLGSRIARLTGPTSLSNKSFEIALLISGGFATALSILFSMSFFSNTLEAVFWVSIFKWSDLYSELYAGDLQNRGRTGKLAFTSVLGSVFVSALPVGILIFGKNLGLSLVIFATCGWAFALLLRYFSTKTQLPASTHQVSNIIRLGLPLGISGAIAALGSTVPQYRVGATLGDAAVGTLAIFLYVYALVDIFGAAYGQAWISRIQSVIHRDSQRKFVLKVSLYSSLAMIPLAIIGLFAFGLMAPFVFGSHFTLSMEQALPLFLALVFLPYTHVISTALFVRMHYKRSMFMMIFSTGITTVFSILLVPTLGISGGLWAVTIGVAVRAITSTVLLIRAK